MAPRGGSEPVPDTSSDGAPSPVSSTISWPPRDATQQPEVSTPSTTTFPPNPVGTPGSLASEPDSTQKLYEAAVTAQSQEKEVEKARDAGDKEALVEALTGLAVANIGQGRGNEALEQAGEALEILRAAQDKKSQNALLRSVCGFDLAQDKPDHALQQAGKAARHFRQQGDKEGEAYGQLASSLAHAAKDEATKAVQSVNLALSLFQKTGNKEGECLAQQSASEAHKIAGDASAALKAAEKSRILAQMLKDRPDQEALCYLRVAEAHMFKAATVEGKDEASWVKAAQAARLAIEKFQVVGDKAGEAVAKTSEERALIGRKENEEAVPWAQKPEYCGTPGGLQKEKNKNNWGDRTSLMYDCKGIRMI